MASRSARRRSRHRDWGVLPVFSLLGGVLLLALALRSFVLAPFLIPSASMMPTLLPGDLVLVAKWPYGFSRHSLPGDLPWPRARLWPATPARADIVVFRTSARPKQDYVKRVVGLSGERIGMRRGIVTVDGKALPRTRIADALLQGEQACHGVPAGPEGSCRYARYRETVATGRSYETLNMGSRPSRDLAPVRVPAGRLLLLGDNRDRSLDSRFPVSEGGIGFVPEGRLLGRAVLVVFSTDGSARGSDPASWVRTVRWERIGLAL